MKQQKKKAKKKLSPAEKKAIKKAREKNNKEKEEEEKDKKEKEKLLNGVRQSGPKRRKQTGKFCKKNTQRQRRKSNLCSWKNINSSFRQSYWI